MRKVVVIYVQPRKEPNNRERVFLSGGVWEYRTVVTIGCIHLLSGMDLTTLRMSCIQDIVKRVTTLCVFHLVARKGCLLSMQRDVKGSWDPRSCPTVRFMWNRPRL